MVDTRSRSYTGPSRNPVVWYCSEAQEPLLLHSDSESPRLLVFGAEGAGKTQVLAMYAHLRCLEHAGSPCHFGATAPTNERLDTVTKALLERAPPDWYTWHEHKKEMRLVFGPTIKCVATKRHSEALGSRIQGFSWPLGCVSDELQDSMREDPDIETRGRGARDGIYRRLCTATAKDSAVFRTFIDSKKTNPLWSLKRLEGTSNAFIHPTYWENLKLTLSPRDYQRRVLAMMVGPERATYPSWDREFNLRPVPQLGAEDVTARELNRWGRNMTVLVGHDPGQIQDVSVLLKAYKVRGQSLPVWYVVGEVTTKGTTEDHVLALLKVLREQFQCNELDRKGRPVVDGRIALVRADPYGDAENKPDRSIYTLFRQQGVTIRPAAYNAKGDKPGRIGKDARIGMMNTLMCNAAGQRRFYVACDGNRKPCAENFVSSVETSERDEHGKAEVKVKGKFDWSHWSVSAAYALWAIERPRMERLAA